MEVTARQMSIACLDDAMPFFDARLADGHRVHAVLGTSAAITDKGVAVIDAFDSDTATDMMPAAQRSGRASV